jgi:hypothetical protein
MLEKKTTRNPVIAEHALCRSGSNLTLNVILDSVNEENHKTPEEIIIAERSDMNISMKSYFGRDY